jgi:hypothetical protein
MSRRFLISCRSWTWSRRSFLSLRLPPFFLFDHQALVLNLCSRLPGSAWCVCAQPRDGIANIMRHGTKPIRRRCERCSSCSAEMSGEWQGRFFGRAAFAVRTLGVPQVSSDVVSATSTTGYKKVPRKDSARAGGQSRSYYLKIQSLSVNVMRMIRT